MKAVYSKEQLHRTGERAELKFSDEPGAITSATFEAATKVSGV
jgi:hypothetical protein